MHGPLKGPPTSYSPAAVSSPDAKPSATIALAVVTRDRPTIFARCIASGLEDAVAHGAEVVIVDQSADEATARRVQAIPGARHVRSGPGTSRGRNVAVAQTVAPLLAFTDDDVVLPEGWLPAIEHIFAQHPEAGAVCGRARMPDGKRFGGTSPGTYRWPHTPFGLGSALNLAFRREALGAAGPFDERLGGGGTFRAAEDTDILYRVMREGWPVVCSDDIDVIHDDWRPRRAMPRLLFGYGIGAGAQSAKHHAAGDRMADVLARGELRQGVVGGLAAAVRLRPVGALSRWAYAAGVARGYMGFRRTQAQ